VEYANQIADALLQERLCPAQRYGQRTHFGALFGYGFVIGER
jgi:hypothetical protein